MFTDAGVNERDAHVYAEGIRRGGSLVSARVDDGQVDAATAILARPDSVDIADRRNEYDAGGWSAFDESAGPWNPAERDAGRTIIPPLPR
jgi:hypothetical protein